MRPKIYMCEGYARLYLPKHPKANRWGLVKRSHYVMERKLKRSLLPYEHVHHINGIKDDDRDCNLRIITSAEHTKLHHTGKKLSNKTKRKIGIANSRSKIKIICTTCGITFEVRPYRKDTAEFCSRSCKSKGIYDKDKFTMKGKTAWNKGMKMSKEHCNILSKSHIGQTPWNKGRREKK